MKKVKIRIPEKLRKGISLKTGRNHTVRLEVTDEALTVHTGLSLFYAMAEALEIPRILNEQVKVKKRESGYPESEHILALAAHPRWQFGYFGRPSCLKRIPVKNNRGHIPSGELT